MKQSANYVPLVRKFFEYDMSAASRALESMTEEEAAEVLQSLPTTLVLQIARNLQVSYAAAILSQTEDAFLRKITAQLEPQFLATLLMHLPKEARERLREHITGKMEEEIRELLEYPEGSVGRTMTSEYLAFSKNLRAQEAISKIRSLAKKRFPSSYVYVVDDENHLIGVLNMRDLMIADPHQRLLCTTAPGHR